MLNVKVFLPLCFSLLLFWSQAHSVRKHFYVGANVGFQSQSYEFRITNVPRGQSHTVDSNRIAPEFGIYAGWNARFRTKFSMGLEFGATFFPSDHKRSLNSGGTIYKIENQFSAIEAALFLGYFFTKTKTLIYLKIGGEYRRIVVEVNSQGVNTKISQTKNAFGFFPAVGIEIPFMSRFFIGAEGKVAFYQQQKYNDERSSNQLTAKITPRFDSFRLRLTFPLSKRR